MMEFTKMFHELRAQFNPELEKVLISGSTSAIYSLRFNSKYNSFLPEFPIEGGVSENRLFSVPDKEIKENLDFYYPVFAPASGISQKKAIILLHGLNERSWFKYLVWAFYLTEHTGRPVILFPISFHINRSPESWVNPRNVKPLLDKRKLMQCPVSMSSFANVALSERLTQEPLRFFLSGYQSATDLNTLIRQIREGEIPLLARGTGVDLFAYSIGAFLGQIVFLANADGLLNDSKLFMFCGGAFFSEMNGISKLIMDSEAFKRLRKYYFDEFREDINKLGLAGPLSMNKLERAFSAMLKPSDGNPIQEELSQDLIKRIKVIALHNDKVIPADKIITTLQGRNPLVPKNIEVLDFPYLYSHETPFPVNDPLISHLVDTSFNQVFQSAADFLY
jgi:hypothetical protein